MVLNLKAQIEQKVFPSGTDLLVEWPIVEQIINKFANNLYNNNYSRSCDEVYENLTGDKRQKGEI